METDDSLRQLLDMPRAMAQERREERLRRAAPRMYALLVEACRQQQVRAVRGWVACRKAMRSVINEIDTDVP